MTKRFLPLGVLFFGFLVIFQFDLLENRKEEGGERGEREARSMVSHFPDSSGEQDLTAIPRGPSLQRDSRVKNLRETATEIYTQKTSVFESMTTGRLIWQEERVKREVSSGKVRVLSKVAALADQVMVVPEEGVTIAEIENLAVSRGFSVLDRQEGSFLLIGVDQPETVEALPATIARLNDAFAGLAFVEPDYLFYPTVRPDDPYFEGGRLWGLSDVEDGDPGNDIDALAGWDLRNAAPEVVVAVTDTGLRTTHQDLQDNLWVNLQEIPGDGLDNDGNGVVDDVHGLNSIEMTGDLADDSGHGTHVAGTIGARGDNGVGVVGVCWDVQLMGLRFIGPDGGSASAAVRAIDYARENGAHIINASWGGEGDSQAIYQAVKRCEEADVLFVAAAGNSNTDLDEVPFYPASIDLGNVITVGASDREDRLSGFSSYGRYGVDLVAPGSDIVSTFSGSDSDYTPQNGTSMAAPHVSGALALARAHFPDDTAYDLKTRLLSSCDLLGSLEERALTGGRLNLRKLLGESTLVPAHDNFATPLELRGNYAFWRGTNARATRAATDDELILLETGQRSLWFTWEPPHSGSTSIQFSGDEGKLSLVVFLREENGEWEADDVVSAAAGREVQFEFEAKEDRDYLFLLDGPAGEPTSLAMQIFLRAGNDNFAEASVVEENEFEARVNNRGATTELFEEDLDALNGIETGYHSLWWKWTPTVATNFVLTTQGSGIDTIMDLFSEGDGGGPSDLVLLRSNDDVGFLDRSSVISTNLDAGQTYWIRVQSAVENQAGQILLRGGPLSEPEITFQPQSLSVELDGGAAFEVGAVGDFLEYQWLRDGVPIPGADAAYYRFRGVTLAHFGDYSVRVSNPVGMIESEVATLQEVRTAPKIDWVSPPQAGGVGDLIRLAVGVTGSRPLTFEWTLDGEVLPGQVGASLSIPLANEDEGGMYQVTVGNDQGTVTSEGMRVSLINNPLNQWDDVNRRIVGAEIKDIHHADGHFVAVSILSGGYLVKSSPDGEVWRSVFLEIPEGQEPGHQEASLAYGNGMWLLAAPNLFGRNEILFYRSSDLETWETILINSEHLTGSSTEQYPLVYHDGYFYASLSGRVIRSADGEVWSNESLNGDFVRADLFESSPIGLLALRKTEGSGALLDLNGVWREVRTADNPAIDRPEWIEWYQGRFVVPTTHEILTSDDGVSWNRVSKPDFIGPGKGILNTSEMLASFRVSGSLFTQSLDGINWETKILETSINPTVIAGDEESFVIGTKGGQLVFGDDVDTIVFPLDDFPEMTSQANEIITGGGRFVIPFYSNLLVSSDGYNWKNEQKIDSRDSSLLRISSTLFGTESGLWKARTFGDNNAPAFHADAHSSRFEPEEFTGIEGESLHGIVGGDLGLIASVKRTNDGLSYGIVRSNDDGETWEEVTLPAGLQSPRGNGFWILEANGVFYFARDGEQPFATRNLTDWHEIPFFMNSPNVAYANGKYWWIWSDGMRSSDDGLVWSEPVEISRSSSQYRKMVSFGDTLVIFDANGSLHLSEDGLNIARVGLPFVVKDFALLDETMVVLGRKNELARTSLSLRNSPSVQIVSPIQGAEMQARSIRVEVDSFDATSGELPRVTLFLDGVDVGSVEGPPYRFSLPVLEEGPHHLRAVAEVSSGIPNSDELSFTVTGLNRTSGGGELTFEPTDIRWVDGFYYAHEYRPLGGSMAVSADGQTWRVITFPTGVVGVESMEFSNGIILVVPVMADRSDKILVSEDSLGWTLVDPPFDDLYIYPNDTGFFASSKRETFTSADGLNWNRVQAIGDIPPGIQDEVGGDPDNFLFVRDNESYLWISKNGGRGWEKQDIGVVWNISYVNGVLFVSGGLSSDPMGVSRDGVNFSWMESLEEITFVGGRFFGQDTRRGYPSRTSEDGFSWSQVEVDDPLGKVVFQPGLGYIAIVPGFNNQGRTEFLYQSGDGIRWSPLEVAIPEGFSEPRYFTTESGLVARTDQVAYFQLNGDSREWIRLTPDYFETESPDIARFLTSADGNVYGRDRSGNTVFSEDGGISWRPIKRDGSRVSAMGSNEAQVIGYSGDGNIFCLSENGGAFEDIDLVLPGSDVLRIITGLAGVDGRWVLFESYFGNFYQSSDGEQWSGFEVTGLPEDLSDFRFEQAKDGLWGTIGRNSNESYFYSENGRDWSPVTVPVGLSSVKQLQTVGDDLILGDEKNAWRTSDLVNYAAIHSPRDAGPFTVLFRVYVSDGTYFATESGKVYRSDDGLSWEVFADLGEGAFNWSTPADLVTQGDSLLIATEQGVVRLTANPENEVDLLVSNLEVESREYGVGEDLTYSFVLSRDARLGELTSEVEVEVFLSRDRYEGNADDLPLGSFAIDWPGNAGSSFEVTRTISLPENLEAGDFYLGLKLDPDQSLNDLYLENGITLSPRTSIHVPAFVLNLSTEGEGSIDLNRIDNVFAKGSQVALSAFAGGNSRFVGWQGDVVGGVSDITVLMDRDIEVQARFSAFSELRVEVSGGGAVTPGAAISTHPVGSDVVLGAVPDPGWAFVGWSGDVTSDSPGEVVSLPENKRVTATFALTYPSWVDQEFGETVPDQEQSKSGDFDEDGVSNYEEWLHGSDPEDRLSTGVQEFEVREDWLILVYQRQRVGIPGALVQVEGSRDGESWGLDEVQQRIIRRDNQLETIEARISRSSDSRGFLRLRYRSPE